MSEVPSVCSVDVQLICPKTGESPQNDVDG